MLSFKEFRQIVSDQEDKLAELGEFEDESIPIQDEDENGGIAWDRYADKYAKYISGFGIKNCFIGVENSNDELQILEIKNNKVEYKAYSPFSGLALKILDSNE